MKVDLSIISFLGGAEAAGGGDGEGGQGLKLTDRGLSTSMKSMEGAGAAEIWLLGDSAPMVLMISPSSPKKQARAVPEAIGVASADGNGASTSTVRKG